MEIKIYSVEYPEDQRRRDGWKSEEDVCPVCQEVFGTWKQTKVGGVVVHKKCRSKAEGVENV